MINRIRIILVAHGTAALLAFGAVNLLVGSATPANVEYAASASQGSETATPSDSAWG
ncbi:hypothetical protein [Streptomyces sp. NPDC001744]|uniref:hypothetical protein n=1 Tax=Streptomyces sp. NPDC001744 TaxID=3364606 RepID=UPI00367CE477